AGAPIALLVAYLLANDALVAARNAMFGANWVHFSTDTARQPLLALISANWAQLVSDARLFCFVPELSVFGAGLVGGAGLIVAELGGAARARSWRRLMNL